MNRTTDGIVPFPPLQHQIIDWLKINGRRHTMYGLIEVDITETRRAIRAHRARTRAPLSLTAFLISCLARAVDENRAVQAYRLRRRRLVLFSAVDVAIMVEREMEDGKMPVPYVIREANTKSPGQIQQEIRAAQEAPPETVAVGSLPSWLQPLLVRGLSAWLLLPAAPRRAVWAWALRNPYRRKRMTGTVGLTAVGMFGRGTGWGLSPTSHTLALIIGGVTRRPAMVGQRIEEREYLCLTLTFDHDVVDGAPAARFFRRLTELIESGAGLHEQDGELSSAAASR